MFWRASASIVVSMDFSMLPGIFKVFFLKLLRLKFCMKCIMGPGVNVKKLFSFVADEKAK